MIRRFLALYRRRGVDVIVCRNKMGIIIAPCDIVVINAQIEIANVIIARRGERLNNRDPIAVAAYIERNSILAKGPRK